ncbi:hypothetical protein CAEBREN_13057 [Caenorhabditis brenneri]|uniref:guanylate kinase n=1 Tax=Caenorhabditis brenneri TaxID=135651 RepID=G0PHP8_CAEBE|nr:hypothetical protein CAEBREN_13057 [Caenorhabditis brenneri]
MPCRPIVLSGPSGGGKSTILTRAMKEHPNSFAFSVSHTTRGPRPGEINGKHYYFTDKEKMQEMIKNGEFLEYATFSGNTYGTSKRTVEEIENSGKICVLDIELQGVRNIKNSHLDARYILIRAPTIQSLEERLRARGTETEETLRKRLQHAQEDLDEINKTPDLFDKVIINDDLERAYKEFVDLIREDLEKTDH